MRLRTNKMCVVEGREQPQVLTWTMMRWSEVHDLEFKGVDPNEENWIWAMGFSRAGELIRTDVEQMDGFHGHILSGHVEVLSVEVIPDVAPPLRRSGDDT